jgi:hypothetical protein
MLVRLDPSNFGGFANTLTGGADIRFAKSNGIHLPYQIERWTDISGNIDTAAIWVLLDTVFGNNSTQYFTIHWGRSGKTSRSASRTVFDTANGFQGAWHLGENATNIADATINSYTGTRSGTPAQTAGGIGYGQTFDGTDDYYTATSVTKVNWAGVFTSSAWLYVSSGVAGPGALWSLSDGDATWEAQETQAFLGDVNASGSNPGKIPKFVGYSRNWMIPTNSIGSDGWQYVTFVYNSTGSVWQIYINGTSETMTTANYSGTTDPGSTFIIGNKVSGDVNADYNGKMDELRIENVQRSANWVKLCYETQKPNSQAAVTENYGEWPYSQKIYLNTNGYSGSNITTVQYNFPVLVRLDTVNFRYFSQTLTGGADVRFAKSDGQHLSYEIERWKDNAANNDSAEIWVKVDTIQPINGLQYINMYWGKAGVTSLSNAPLVFQTSNSYSGVWHLKEEGDATTYYDATANGYNGTGVSTTTSSDVTAMTGIGIDLDGTADCITSAGFTSGNFSQLSISTWVRLDNQTDWKDIISKETGDYGSAGFGLRRSNSDQFVFTFYNGGKWELTSASTFTDNGATWYFITGTYDGAAQRLYTNGVKTDSTTGLSLAITGSANALNIGRRVSSTDRYIDGVLDEVVISSTARSDQWIRLCYENQKSSQTLCDYEDYSSWRYSRRVTINTADMGLSGEVVKFPLLVRLNADNFDFSQANGTAQDIRFAKANGVHLLYEKERWDSTNALGELWVLVDTVKSANSTQYINMYWGKTGVFSKSNPTRVFDTANGFAGVWHLNEDPFAGGAIILDRTAFANNGTPNGTMITADNVEGVVGKALDFDGGDDYITFGDINAIDGVTKLTVSSWFKHSTLVDYASVISKMGAATDGWQMNEMGAPEQADDMFLTTRNAGDAVSQDGRTTNNCISTGVWKYGVMVFDGTQSTNSTRLKFYLDGTAQTLTFRGTIPASMPSTAAPVQIAKDNFEAIYISGIVDESIIAKTNRSADWIKLCYETQRQSPGATITDVEAFRPVSLFTTAAQCSVWTTGWTLVFDKAAGGAGAYGGITILTDSAHGKTTGSGAVNPSNNVGAGQNLFYITYDGTSSMSPTAGAGTWTFIDTVGRIYARLRQTCTLVDLPFTMDYTIQGSGKMFIRASVTNRTGGNITGKTLQFNLRRRVPTSGNVTVSAGNTTANLCPYVLVSCDSARHLDPMLSMFTLWNDDSGAVNDASGLVNTAGSGLAGWESTSWGILAGQRQVWNFMLDFSHKAWNDSTGVGAYARSYRTPDSLEFIAGFPVLEQAWEEYIYGHWKLDETTGDSAFDFSGFSYHGKKTGSGRWTAGRMGNGLSFSGSQKITVVNTAKLDGRSGDGFTVMMWIKPASAISTSSTLFGKYSAGSLGYKFLGDAGKLSVKADGSTISAATDVGTGTWRHVAMSCNPSARRVKIYLNGRLDKLDTATAITVSANADDILIGDGYDGVFDDVRYFYRELSEETIETVYKMGYRVANGMYQVRADNNSTVHLRIDGNTNKRRFPVFQIDNYWGTAVPTPGSCVRYNGSALTENTHYFTWLSTTYRKLFIAFNKTVSADSTLIYMDDKNAEGSRAITPARKMVWGSYSGARNWFWCKNFTGDYFGAANTNQYYFAWKMDSTIAAGSKSRGGEVCRFKSSNRSPYFRPDTSVDSSLMSTVADTGGTPLGHHTFYYASGAKLYSTYVAAIPSYTVVESSAVRIQLKLNQRSLNATTTDTSKIITRWTLYPTGQVFRWDSVCSFKNAPQKITSGGGYQRHITSPSVAMNKPRMRAIIRTGDTIHDNVFAGLGFKSGTQGACTYPWKGSGDTLANNTVSAVQTGVRLIGQDTVGLKRYWSGTPLEMAFYYDYQRDNLAVADTAKYRDSVANGVQCIGIAGGAALGMTTGTLLSGAGATTGDLNADGFNEREGAYVIRASNNSVLFTLPARKDTSRYFPVFRITNYMANQKPQYIYCYKLHPASSADTMALIEGYEYNIYHNRTANELVIQIDSIIRDSTVYYISADRTLAVQMSRFGAAGGDGCDTVYWKTESENENLGYFLYRRIKPAFLDSLSKAVDSTAHDSTLDNAGALFKRKRIAYVDTGWIPVNKEIIPSASGGTAFGPTRYLHIDYRNVYNDVVYEYRIESIDFQNNSESYGPAEARPMGWVPLKFALWGNYPNPFRKTTFIRFDLPVKSKVDIRIYNLQGRLIRRLVKPEKLLKIGRHRIMWDGLGETGQPVAAGPYIYHMVAAKKFAKAKVMVMVR